MKNQKLIALVFIFTIYKHPNVESVELNQITGEKVYDVWVEEVPIMGHLAVAKDGSVLVFKERRDQKLIEVKRSEDAGKTWSDPRPPLNGFVARFGRQRPSNGAKKLSLGGLEMGFFVQNLKCSDHATDLLFTMFLSENTLRNHLNIIEKCAFHRLLNGISFFPLYLCSQLQLLSIWVQSKPAKVLPKGGHG